MSASDNDIRRAALRQIREAIGLTQDEMAKALGLRLRAYSDIETGRSKCRPLHVLAAERLTLPHAVARGDASLLPDGVRGAVQRFARAEVKRLQRLGE